MLLIIVSLEIHSSFAFSETTFSYLSFHLSYQFCSIPKFGFPSMEETEQ